MNQEDIIMNQQLISKYLCTLRRQHALTQEELADRLHLSRQAVSQWETGDTLPDPESLLALSKLYEVTINELLEPNIPPMVIDDFEQLPKIPEKQLAELLRGYDADNLVKACMGASPDVNRFMSALMPEIDFEARMLAIGRIRIEEAETAQRQILAFINLAQLKT